MLRMLPGQSFMQTPKAVGRIVLLMLYTQDKPALVYLATLLQCLILYSVYVVMLRHGCISCKGVFVMWFLNT